MLEGYKNWITPKIQKMTIWDIKLIKFSTAAFTLMIAKLWSPILSLDWHWYAILGVLFIIKPLKLVLEK